MVTIQSQSSHKFLNFAMAKSRLSASRCPQTSKIIVVCSTAALVVLGDLVGAPQQLLRSCFSISHDTILMHCRHQLQNEGDFFHHVSLRPPPFCLSLIFLLQPRPKMSTSLCLPMAKFHKTCVFKVWSFKNLLRGLLNGSFSFGEGLTLIFHSPFLVSAHLTTNWKGTRTKCPPAMAAFPRRSLSSEWSPRTETWLVAI